MIVFDKYWFRENQAALLGLVNSPVIGGLVRRGMWIEGRGRVVKITTDSVHTLQKDGTIRATIYTGNQYSEALRKNFSKIWEAAHWWDMQLANRYVPAWNLGFDTLTAQPAEAASNDVNISSTNPTTNLDASGTLYVGELGGETIRTLVKFDISTIPSTASVTSATYTVTTKEDNSSNTRTHTAYRSLRAWTETGATWNTYDGTNNWGTAGSSNATTDYGATLGTASVAHDAALNTAINFTLTASEIQKYVDGTWTNNGFFHKAATESSDLWGFWDAGAATSSRRPKLVVNYTTAGVGGFAIWCT